MSARDRELDNPYSRDFQLMAIPNGRRVPTDRLTRVAKPHKLQDPDAGPMIAVRLHILSRKTLGGIETTLDSQVCRADGALIDGLLAAGEVAVFGGGGVHRYRALEGTLLAGCILLGAGSRPGRGTPAALRVNRPETPRAEPSRISYPSQEAP